MIVQTQRIACCDIFRRRTMFQLSNHIADRMEGREIAPAFPKAYLDQPRIPCN